MARPVTLVANAAPADPWPTSFVLARLAAFVPQWKYTCDCEPAVRFPFRVALMNRASVLAPAPLFTFGAAVVSNDGEPAVLPHASPVVLLAKKLKEHPRT